MSMTKAQQLSEQLQVLENQMGNLSYQESLLTRSLQEAQSAIRALRDLGEADECEILAPLGTGVFIKTRASSKDGIIMNVGAGVALDKDRDYVINFLERIIKENDTSLRNVTSQRMDIMMYAEQKRNELLELVKAGAPAPNS